VAAASLSSASSQADPRYPSPVYLGLTYLTGIMSSTVDLSIAELVPVPSLNTLELEQRSGRAPHALVDSDSETLTPASSGILEKVSSSRTIIVFENLNAGPRKQGRDRDLDSVTLAP
jgi:hypothetical protein